MMTETRPDVCPTRRYTEASASRLLGVHRHTMENYRKSGRIKAKIGANGRVHYMGIDLIQLWNAL